MRNAHGLDCLHFPLLPSMTLQMALKITDVELDLITDPDLYRMFESGIRGGLSYVCQRHARANFSALPDYRPDVPTSYLAYWDCNSLYATCQMYSLPVGNFRFLSDDEMRSFDVSSVSSDSPVGYVLEVDLKYPESLHEWHNAYPLAPEYVEIVDDMISPTLRDMFRETDTLHVPTSKLVSNLRDKTRYVTHYKCLQFYLAHGLELIRVHRIVAFEQRPFMFMFLAHSLTQSKNSLSHFRTKSIFALSPSFAMRFNTGRYFLKRLLS